MDDTDKKLIKTLAVRFATAMWLEVGTRGLIEIDHKNQTSDPGVCASHDFVDANMTMDKVFKEVGVGETGQLWWNRVWEYTKAVGFCRLRGIHSHEGYPTDAPDIRLVDNDYHVWLPDVNAPVIVAADYWGNNPRLQVMIYEADGNDEPLVKIRFTPDGKIQEVVFNQNGTRGHPTTYDDRINTPWDKERDSNPPCREGDLLQMPSGQFGEVMRLRKRYDNYEDYVRYDSIYQVARRLYESVLDAPTRGKVSQQQIADLWNTDPLTVATTDPSDMSIVTEDTTELPDPEKVLNHVSNN